MLINHNIIQIKIFFSVAQQPLGGLVRLIVEVFRDHRHTTIGRTPLDEGSARRRDNTQHLQQTDIHTLSEIRTRNPSKRVAEDPTP
jgi:hypothetical protein